MGGLQVVEEEGRLGVEHGGRVYGADEYLGLVHAQQQRRDAGGAVYRVLNITTIAGVVWVALGLLGQLLFSARMLVQWLVSEKAKRSVVPPVFWYLSLAGASMLLAYFVWRKDIVGVIGQATGWAIYARNIALLRRRAAVADSAPA